jgi:pimeloyl-ACP methyl ester carboxylesterase
MEKKERYQDLEKGYFILFYCFCALFIFASLACANPEGSFNIWTHTIETGEANGGCIHNMADVNGDGREDLIQISTTGGIGWIGLATVDGNFELWSHTFGTGEMNGAYRHYFADINNDGRDDLIQISIRSGTGWVGLATPEGNFDLWTHSFGTGEFNGAYCHYFADVNGDGRDDLIQISIRSGTGWVGLATPEGNFDLWSHTFGTGEMNGAYQHYFGDVNGDGRDDLIQISTRSGTGWVGLATPEGNFDLWTHSFGTGEFNGRYFHQLADIDGDGREDLVQFSKMGGAGWIGLASPEGNFEIWSHEFPTGELSCSYVHLLADLNNDGRSDLVQFEVGGDDAWIALANQVGNFEVWTHQFSTNSVSNWDYSQFLADVNGDGRADLIHLGFGYAGWIGLAEDALECEETGYPIILLHGHGKDLQVEGTWTYMLLNHLTRSCYTNYGQVYDSTILPSDLDWHTFFLANFYRSHSSETFGSTIGKIGAIPNKFDSALYYSDNYRKNDDGSDPLSADRPSYEDSERVSYAERLQIIVDEVLLATGAPKVNIVTHSMGGLVARAYIRWLGGANKVHKLLTIGTPNNGLSDNWRVYMEKMDGDPVKWQWEGEYLEMCRHPVFMPIEEDGESRPFVDWLNEGWDEFCRENGVQYATIRGYYDPWWFGNVSKGDGVIPESAVVLNGAEFNDRIYAAHMDAEFFPNIGASNFSKERSIVSCSHSANRIIEWLTSSVEE